MGCAASSPLARALNPARFINQAKEAASKDAVTGPDDTPYPLHGESLQQQQQQQQQQHQQQQHQQQQQQQQQQAKT